MKCPYCGATMAAPFGWNVSLSEADIIVLTCPHCLAILGAVNKPQRP